MEWVRSKDPTAKEAYGVQSESGKPNSAKGGETLLSSLETPARTVFLGSLERPPVPL